MLDGLRDPANAEVWRAFDQRFRPLLASFGRRVGLGPADAADVAQETLMHFVRDYRAGKYDRSRGRLGAWLMGIARHRLEDIRRSRAARREVRGESAIGDMPSASELSAAWEAECRQSVMEQALRELAQSGRVSPRTLEVFRMHVIDQTPAADVAARLGTTARAVYLAKHRCLRRLREIVDELNEQLGVA